MKLSKEKLEIAMARAKLDRNELSKKAMLSRSTINTAFTRCTCKPSTAGRIAEALSVDVTEIVK